MKIADHLTKEQKQQLNKVKLSNTHFSRRELEDLMGKNRDTYKRKNGALRRK